MTRSRASAIALSVLLHAAIFAGGVFSFSFSQPMAMPRQLAIEATVVDLSAVEALRQAEREAELAAEREQLRLREEAQERAREAEEEAENERQRVEQARLDAERRERQLQEKRAAEQRAEEERVAREAAAAKEAERLAREAAERERQAELKRQQEAEQKRLADAERRRKEETERKAREAEARRQAEAEALLVAQIEEEERRLTAARSGLKDQYVRLIQQKITRSWLRPESAAAGLRCEVSVTQLPSREVVDVRVGKCNGDAATVRSIEAAVYKASPLPAPPDPALFERKLIIEFIPDS